MAILSTIALGTPVARAQTPDQRDPVVAEALFKAARTLLEAGDYAAGCPKFEASLALNPSASTTLNIAKCHEHEGRIATAWGDYNRALVLNHETPGAERQRALEDIAQQGIRSLEPRLPKLRIVIARPPPGLRVLRDGKELPLTTLGEALPADPGQHEVSVSAPGYRAETRSVILEEGKTATVEASLQFVIHAPAPPPPAKARGGGSLVPAGIAFGLGAVGLGVGAVTGAVSLKMIGDVKAGCNDNHCLTTDSDKAASAKTLGNVSTAGFVVGGVGVAAGAVLLVLRPKGGPAAATMAGGEPPWASLSAGLGMGRIEIRGRF